MDIRSDAWYHQRLRLNQDLGAMDFLLKKNIFEPGPFFLPSPRHRRQVVGIGVCKVDGSVAVFPHVF